MSHADRLIVINAVGLTPRWLEHAPRLQALARAGWLRDLREILPAVTCSAQASILTGKTPAAHGIVANGWLFRDTMEVRFWQQSNRLIESPPIYQTLRQRAMRQDRSFTCAKLFWWFNQGAAVDWSVTPKPHYGCDGSKAFDITGAPDLVDGLKRQLGPFPFHTFWGPKAGRPCTDWIARAAAFTLIDRRPTLTLAYLPHLDYDPQRFGPSGCDMPRLVGELDQACGVILDAAKAEGAEVWVVSEYGHVDVQPPTYPNRLLRRAGLLEVRDGPFGETIDYHASQAFAVCDHQLCHIYVTNRADEPRVAAALRMDPNVDQLYVGAERAAIGLDHPRAGEIIALAKPNRWFAYPYWLDDARAPDFARTVDIHRKPGFDPCEMFFDPSLTWPTGKVLWRLAQKTLGFRTKFDVIGLDARIVKGSHGLAAADPLDRPLLIGSGPAPGASLRLTDVHDLIAQRLGLADDHAG